MDRPVFIILFITTAIIVKDHRVDQVVPATAVLWVVILIVSVDWIGVLLFVDISRFMISQHFWVFTARCTIVQSSESTVLLLHVVCLSVCPSVRLSVCDVGGSGVHGWKSWKLIKWTISPTHSLFIAQRASTYWQGKWEFGNLGKTISAWGGKKWRAGA